MGRAPASVLGECDASFKHIVRSVKISADAGYTYGIATFGGSIHTCFGAQGGSGHLRGQVESNGADQASLHLSTMHGTIELCDK